MGNTLLNLVPASYLPEVHLSQYDVGRELKFTLKDGSSDYTVPSGAVVTVKATKPSGLGFVVNAVAEGSVVTLSNTETMTNENGRFPAELSITQGSTVIGTSNFIFNIERSPHPEGTIDGDAESLLPELTLLVERVEAAASSVLDMQVVADTLPPGSQATYSYDEELNKATFGIPQGEPGAGAVGTVASAYDASKTYAVGDYAIHNNDLYRCITAITTAEVFTASHWIKIVLADDVTDLKSDLDEYTDIFTGNVDESVKNWLDEHPEATTTVADDSLTTAKYKDYSVTNPKIADQAITEAKFAESLKLKTIKDYVTPEMFGAKGDGVTDDTQAIQEALDSDGDVYFSKKTYLISSNLTLAKSKQLIGNGTIQKNVDSTGEVNGILVLNNPHIAIIGLTFKGNGTCKGIVFDDGCHDITFIDVYVSTCDQCFYDYKMCFMIAFIRVHCIHSEKAFCFDNTITKTSLTFIDCWAENCGTAYYFFSTQYTSLYSCGADYCNYKDSSNPYGDGGHGSKTSTRGVYSFLSSHNIGVYNCGTENSYGNGAVYSNDSTLIIHGLSVYGLKSEYAFSVSGTGFIVTGTEKSRIDISSCRFNDYANPNISSPATSSLFAFVYNNYSSYAYGELNEYLIHAKNILGMANVSTFKGYTNSCHYENSFDIEQKNVITSSYNVIYKAVRLSGNSTNLTLPFKSFGNANIRHLLKVTVLKDPYNINVAKAYTVDVACASLTSVLNPLIVNKSDDGITAAASGLNLKITLPETLTACIVKVEIISSRPSLFDFDNIALG